VQVSGRVRQEAREPDVDTDDDLVTRIEALDLDDGDQVLRAVGRIRGTEDRACGQELLGNQRDGFVAIEADVSVLAALAGAEVNVTDADGEDIGVTNTGLAVVLSIEVVGNEDRLVRVGSFAVGDRLGQEDYAVAAVEVLGLQLLHHVHIDRPVIERQVLTFEDPDLRPFRWTGVVVARAFSGSEVKLEIARFSRSQASRPEPEGAGQHGDGQGG
jgi:hypothetical protein